MIQVCGDLRTLGSRTCFRETLQHELGHGGRRWCYRSTVKAVLLIQKISFRKEAKQHARLNRLAAKAGLWHTCKIRNVSQVCYSPPDRAPLPEVLHPDFGSFVEPAFGED